MTTEIIYGSRAFISRDRNLDMEPATWPFRRAQGIEAQRATTTQIGVVEDESPVASAMRPKGVSQ